MRDAGGQLLGTEGPILCVRVFSSFVSACFWPWLQLAAGRCNGLCIIAIGCQESSISIRYYGPHTAAAVHGSANVVFGLYLERNLLLGGSVSADRLFGASIATG